MRWIRRIAIAVAGLVLLAVIVIYAGSQIVISRSRVAPLGTLHAATDPAAIAEGARMAHFVGCRGCHGPDGKGVVFVDNLVIGRLTPPAIARAAAGYSDAGLERLIRYGVKRDGTTAIIMPAHALGHLADDDVAAIMGWVRTLHPAPDDLTKPARYGPLGRLLLLSGALPISYRPETVSTAHRPADIGQYIVSVSCEGCHRLHEPTPAGDGSEIAPPLADVAAAYDPAAFKRLIRTGVGMTRPQLGEMSDVARSDLKYLSDDEIAAVQDYLKRQAAK